MLSRPPTPADRRACRALLNVPQPQGIGDAQLARLRAMGLLDPEAPGFEPSSRARRLWSLFFALALGAGCGGAPFALDAIPAALDVEAAAPSAPDAGDGDARRLGPAEDASPDAPAIALDAAGPDAGDGDASQVDAEIDAGDGGAAADRAAPSALCCSGAGSASCSAAAWSCYPAGSSCSETCAPRPDGGQRCTTQCTGSPESCASCPVGRACIAPGPGGQTLPGTVAACP
jgi:hypothetical protein